jgi:CheY-like chemotaxis protein
MIVRAFPGQYRVNGAAGFRRSHPRAQWQRILVVEDNDLNRKLFCDLLKANGFTVEPVADGREAIERTRLFVPNLVIMDIQLPNVSGLELIEALKGDPNCARSRCWP